MSRGPARIVQIANATCHLGQRHTAACGLGCAGGQLNPLHRCSYGSTYQAVQPVIAQVLGALLPFLDGATAPLGGLDNDASGINDWYRLGAKADTPFLPSASEARLAEKTSVIRVGIELL